MGIGSFFLSLYKWDRLSDQSLREVKAKAENMIISNPYSPFDKIPRSFQKDLDAAHKALDEIDAEMQKRGTC